MSVGQDELRVNGCWGWMMDVLLCTLVCAFKILHHQKFKTRVKTFNVYILLNNNQIPV